MKKWILSTTLLLAFVCPVTAVLAQEGDDPPSGAKQQTRCAPFSDLYKRYEADGFAPVFLGQRGKEVDLAIIQDKAGHWFALKFVKAPDGTLIACMASAGDYSVSVPLEPKIPSEGVKVQ